MNLEEERTKGHSLGRLRLLALGSRCGLEELLERRDAREAGRVAMLALSLAPGIRVRMRVLQRRPRLKHGLDGAGHLRHGGLVVRAAHLPSGRHQAHAGRHEEPEVASGICHEAKSETVDMDIGLRDTESRAKRPLVGTDRRTETTFPEALPARAVLQETLALR
eukprot:scaffold641_cov237-Pinguiococcus_pyrenoidosus.AAC.13